MLSDMQAMRRLFGTEWSNSPTETRALLKIKKCTAEDRAGVCFQQQRSFYNLPLHPKMFTWKFVVGVGVKGVARVDLDCCFVGECPTPPPVK